MSVDFVDSFRRFGDDQAAAHWDRWQVAAERLEKFTRRRLADGREAFVRLQPFNARLVIVTAPDSPIMYREDGWCYTDAGAAAIALAAWDPASEPEPSGWIRHPASARRRLPIICGCCDQVRGFLEYRRP